MQTSNLVELESLGNHTNLSLFQTLLTLQEGQIFKNYKHLCSTLFFPVTTSTSKEIQLNFLNNFFEIEQKGHSLTIKHILYSYLTIENVIEHSKKKKREAFWTDNLGALILNDLGSLVEKNPTKKYNKLIFTTHEAAIKYGFVKEDFISWSDKDFKLILDELYTFFPILNPNNTAKKVTNFNSYCQEEIQKDLIINTDLRDLRIIKFMYQIYFEFVNNKLRNLLRHANSKSILLYSNTYVYQQEDSFLEFTKEEEVEIQRIEFTLLRKHNFPDKKSAYKSKKRREFFRERIFTITKTLNKLPIKGHIIYFTPEQILEAREYKLLDSVIQDKLYLTHSKQSSEFQKKFLTKHATSYDEEVILKLFDYLLPSYDKEYLLQRYKSYEFASIGPIELFTDLANGEI